MWRRIMHTREMKFYTRRNPILLRKGIYEENICWNHLLFDSKVWLCTRVFEHTSFFLGKPGYFPRKIVVINPSKYWNPFKGLRDLGIYHLCHTMLIFKRTSDLDIMTYWWIISDYTSEKTKMLKRQNEMLE